MPIKLIEKLQVLRLSRPSGAKNLAHAHFSRSLDLLRAVAVLCVVASHLLDARGMGGHGSLGRFGVVLFFFHTSLVLTASLDRLHQPGFLGRMTFAFYVRRIFRIYPLSILFVLAVWLLRLPPAPGHPFLAIFPAQLASNLLLVQNMTYQADVQAPLWTLPLEVQMYVLLPLLFLAIARKRYVSLVLWAASVPLAILLTQLSERLSVFRYGPCFVAGVVAFDLLRIKGRALLPAWLWPLVLVAAAAAFGPWDNVSLPAKIGRAWACSLLIACCYPFLREMSPHPGQRVVQWIAEHSYGIYLCHGLLIWFAFERLPHWAAWPTFLLMVVLLPTALYRWLERPLIRLGNRLSRKLVQQQAAVGLAGEYQAR